jgi:hypothetical protein
MQQFRARQRNKLVERRVKVLFDLELVACSFLKLQNEEHGLLKKIRVADEKFANLLAKVAKGMSAIQMREGNTPRKKSNHKTKPKESRT